MKTSNNWENEIIILFVFSRFFFYSFWLPQMYLIVLQILNIFSNHLKLNNCWTVILVKILDSPFTFKNKIEYRWAKNKKYTKRYTKGEVELSVQYNNIDEDRNEYKCNFQHFFVFDSISCSLSILMTLFTNWIIRVRNSSIAMYLWSRMYF